MFVNLQTPEQRLSTWRDIRNKDHSSIEEVLEDFSSIKLVSRYLDYYTPFHGVTGKIVLGDYSDPENMWHFDSGDYVFPRNPSIFPNSNPKRRESFEGLNFDVWNNAKFTTVFSWDNKVGYDMKYYYKSSGQNRENDLDSIGFT